MPQTAAVITGSHDNRSLSPQSWHRSPSKQAILKTHRAQLRSENSKYAKYKSLTFPRSLISYSFLPFLFLVVLASLPTSCWHQKQQGTRPSSSLLQLPAYQRHLCAYCTSEDREQQNMRSVPVSFTGYREEGRGEAGELSDFLIQRSPFGRAHLYTRLRPVGQSAEADEAELD